MTDFVGFLHNVRQYRAVIAALSVTEVVSSMSAVQHFESQALTLTASAIQRVKRLRSEEGNDALKLRVFVTGGGCSGFQYGFTFDELMADDDTAVDAEGVTALVDPLSFQYLAGAVVDYQEGLEGSRFVIDNPNAQTTCGCGSSFSA